MAASLPLLSTSLSVLPLVSFAASFSLSLFHLPLSFITSHSLSYPQMKWFSKTTNSSDLKTLASEPSKWWKGLKMELPLQKHMARLQVHDDSGLLFPVLKLSEKWGTATVIIQRQRRSHSTYLHLKQPWRVHGQLAWSKTFGCDYKLARQKFQTCVRTFCLQ